MPRKPRQFINGEIYHIVLRRVGNELLFGDVDDYYRMIFYIYECNTTKPVLIRERRKAREKYKKMIRGLTPDKIPEWKDEREHLVEVLAFCLMPNHIHLLLRQLKDNGISKYIQKIAAGYAAYFKNKYGIKLRGHFFQDRFSATLIENDEQLRVVFTYIHTNPVELVEPGWKDLKVEDEKRAIEFLKSYKWSSYLDYLGEKNFPSVTQRDFLLEVMGGKEGCQKWVGDWIAFKKGLKKLMETLSLE